MGTTLAYAANGVAAGVQDVSISLASLSPAVGQRAYFFCCTNNTSSWSEQGTSDLTKLESDAFGSAAFYVDIDGSESATYTFRRTITTLVTAMVVVVLRKNDGPISDITISQGFGGAMTIGEVNVGEDGADILHIVCRPQASGTGCTPPGNGSGTPGNPIERVDANSSGSAQRYAVADETGVSAGPSGSRAWTVSPAGPARAVMFAINPAEGFSLHHYDGSSETEYNLFYYDGFDEIPYRLTEVAS